MKKSINEQVIVITGASSGIGLATAQVAAKRGAKVVLAARNRSDLERWAAKICREGGRAAAMPVDVTNYAQVQNLVRSAIAQFGRIDTFISGAAVSVYGTFDQVSVDDYQRVMDVNFMGQVHCAKAVLPYLKQTSGTFISIGSGLSDRGVPLQGAYCASKHALKGWIDSLRTELEREQASVHIVLVKPSSLNTPLFRKAKTVMGVEPQPIPPVYDPQLAVSKILHASEHPQRDVYVGAAAKLLSISERINPKLIDAHQRRFGFESQKSDRARGPEVSNLYEPLEQDGGVFGGYSSLSSWRGAFKSSRSQPFYGKLALAFLGGVTLSMMKSRRAA